MSTHKLIPLGCAAALVTLLTPVVAEAGGGGHHGPRLVGRAVLPVQTYADGPPSGAGLVPAGQTSTVINGITFPTPSQPVEGFSAILPGRRHGELLLMPDNGYGGKANSRDFLIRAYYATPDFKTKRGGSGAIAIGESITFSDPDGLIGFPIVREGTPERWLTGGDIDPESVQRGRHGDLWVGDEFGPWILHFDAAGRLVEAPIALPDNLMSPNNPFVVGTPTVNNSRGIEAMAMTPSGKHLMVVMEGSIPGDELATRRIYRYDTRRGTFVRLGDYRVEVDGHFVADAQALDSGRLLLIERDGGRGDTATFRRVYSVRLNSQGAVSSKRMVVDLAAIPDPDGVSLPPIHDGDVGLGNPFKVTCESIEALHVVNNSTLMLGCDNNFPNTGRNPMLADDSELIVVSVPGL